MVAFATILVGLTVLLTRRKMIWLFTEIPEIQNLFAVGMIFLVIETIPDSNQFVL
jgi:Na+-driven multidrug efflux pump